MNDAVNQNVEKTTKAKDEAFQTAQLRAADPGDVVPEARFLTLARKITDNS